MKKETTFTKATIATTYEDLQTSEVSELWGSYVVSEESNREYQAVLGDLNSWYNQNTIAHPNAVNDLTHEFIQNSYTFLLPPDQSTMHTKQETEYLKKLKVGEKISVQGRIAEKYEKRGRNYVVWELEEFDPAGALVVRVRTTRTVGKAAGREE